MNFSELVSRALLGTESPAAAPNAPLPDPAAETAPRPLLARFTEALAAERPEIALLGRAALVGTHERVGRRPTRSPAPLPDPAPAETQKLAAEPAQALLRRLLQGEAPEQLPEWLTRAARAGLLAAPETLPDLLARGAAQPDWRDLIRPTLGARGVWLAERNPAWAWVRADTADAGEEVWQTGTRALRAAWWQRLRRQDPARARDLLAAAWAEEGPEARAAFLVGLAAGLSPADEEFLNLALRDKRKEVRREAGTLLCRLPASALSRRAADRVRPCVHFARGRWEITLPEQCDTAMVQDGVEPKPPAGTGEKAWWLIQLLEMTPLAEWTPPTAPDRATLLAQARAGEWRQELLAGWVRAALRQADADWAETLLTVTWADGQWEACGGLLAVLPPARQQAVLLGWLASPGPAAGEPIARLLARSDPAWSPAFSTRVVAFLRTEARADLTAWGYATSFTDFARRLHPAALPGAVAGWPTEAPGWPAWERRLADFFALIEFRTLLHATFDAEPSPAPTTP